MNPSEPHEPSYYEIALTNRQVVVAFVILLVCLLAAFLSGVWIGRGGAQAGPAEQVAAVTSAEPAEGTELEEFEFFDKPAESAAAPPAGTAPAAPPASATPAAPADTAGTTLREDLEGQAPPPAPEPERRAAVPPPRVEEHEPPVPSRAERIEPDDEAPPAAEPRPAPETVRPRRLPEAAAPAKPAAGSVVIQVFSSSEEEQAVGVRDRLARSGLPAFLSPVDVADRKMYRVRLGPYPSRADAQAAAERVRKQHKLDTWLTTE